MRTKTPSCFQELFRAACLILLSTKTTAQITNIPAGNAPVGLPNLELILAADLWAPEPMLLSAAVGFDGIIGIPDGGAQTRENVLAQGGAWNDDVSNCSISGTDPVPAGALTASPTSQQVMFTYQCTCVPENLDGFPLCFSWPVVPSSITNDVIQYTRSDGAIFTPACIGAVPNMEFNEQHCVVIFDDFINRQLPGEPNRLYMSSVEVVGDLELVGPNGTIVSAKGMRREPPVNETSYLTGPRFLGWARLVPLHGDGEGFAPLAQINQALGFLPNSGIEEFATPANRVNLYRLRLFYSGGMKPNGVTALTPAQFDDYFALEFRQGVQNISASNSPLEVTNGTTVIGTVTVLGLADLGIPSVNGDNQYDLCYNEDSDNYIDIILETATPAALEQLSSVVAFEKTAGGLYNPGGPGRTPTPGVRYTAEAVPQVVPIFVDLDREFEVSYCKNAETQEVSFDQAQCQAWLDGPPGTLEAGVFGTSLADIATLEVCRSNRSISDPPTEDPTTVLFTTPGNPESVVTSANAYFAGQLAQTGGAILKYNLDGSQDTNFSAPQLINIRGLAINSAGDMVWAAHDGGVAELALSADQSELTLQFLYNLSSVMPEPNGLCLTPDESYLFATGGTTQEMIQIDLTTQTWTVKIDDARFLPTGCSVSPDNEIVWVLTRNGAGILQYNIAAETVGEPEAFSQPIAIATADPQVVGDGLALWDNKLYISVWQIAPPFNGDIWECDLAAMLCEVWSPGLTAADIQVDSKTPDQPQLILPNLVTRRVQARSLPSAMSMPTNPPVMMPADAPTMMPTTDSPAMMPSDGPTSGSVNAWTWYYGMVISAGFSFILAFLVGL